MKTDSDKQAGERTQHTPGPWNNGAFEDRVGHRIFADSGEVGNFVAARHCERAVNTNGYADARLVAAAPELLEACKALLSDWRAVNPNESVPDEINVDEHWEAISTAIAKAEGKA